MDAVPPLTNRQSGGFVFTHGSLPGSGYFFEEQLLRRNSAHFRLPSGFTALPPVPFIGLLAISGKPQSAAAGGPAKPSKFDA